MNHSSAVGLTKDLKTPQQVFTRILVATDGSQSSLRAAKYAVRLARRYQAELIVVSVIQRPSRTHMKHPAAARLERYYKYASRNAEQWIDKVKPLAESLGVNVTSRVLQGATSIVKAITDYAANEKVDLIVVGRRGTGGFKRLLLGSVSNGVVNHAASPVLVVR
jgi:nucleotide-binding universal stress UspA family protein